MPGDADDRLALRALVDAYAQSVDARDADRFAALFAPDGETVHVHWKDPNAWPEHYYEQVGRRKPAAVGGEA